MLKLPSVEPESTRAVIAAWVGLATAFSARVYLTVIAALGLLATLPMAFGLSAVVIHGDSMRPVIGVGDVVLSVPLERSAPTPMGQVVGFQAPTGSATRGLVMHRIVATNRDGTLVTAGDANAQVDSAPLDRAAIQSVGVVLVRGAGLPAYWADSRNYLNLVVWMVLTGLAVAVEIAGLRRGSGQRYVAVPAAAIVVLGLLAGGPATHPEASASFTASTVSKGNRWAYPPAEPATRLAFSTSPNNATGGVAFTRQPVVQLLDAQGRPTTGTRTITLSLTGGTGTLSCTKNPLSTQSGVASFAGCTVDKVGTYRLVASANTLTSATSAAFTISVGPAARLAFTAVPEATAQTVVFARQPAVQLRDAGGNLTASTASVTLSLTGSPAGAVLSCAQNPKPATAGAVAFSGCSINKAGTYTLTAKASGLPDAVSSSFVVTAAPALTCNSTTWMATFSWSPATYTATTYKLYVNGTSVHPQGADGWNPYVQLTSANVPATQFPEGTASVAVYQVLAGGSEKLIGTGTVVLGRADYRTYLCG